MFEAFTPPYYTDMREAVDAFLETVTYVGGPLSYLAVGVLVDVVAPGAILVWSGAAIMLAGIVALSGVLRDLDG